MADMNWLKRWQTRMAPMARPTGQARAGTEPAAQPAPNPSQAETQAPSPSPNSSQAAQQAACPASAGTNTRTSTKAKGDVAEHLALQHLQAQGLRLLARNQHTPGRGGGEVDLVMLAADGTLGFVEVRARRSRSHGGAAASVGAGKQARIVLAARHYLMRWPGEPPPCRFDVVTVEGEGPQAQVNWLQAAFDAPG